MTRNSDSRAEIAELKKLANARMLDVLAGCGVRERPNRKGLISMCSPVRRDTNPSLAIWTHGGVLTLKDYAVHAEAVDIIGAVAYLQRWDHLPHGGFREATEWLRDRLGVRSMSKARRDRLAEQAKQALAEAQAKAAKDAAATRRQARKLFFEGLPILDTPVETYWREARGIDLRDAPFVGPRGGSLVPGCLRYHPRLYHRDAAGRESHWPAMLAACVDYSGYAGRARHGKPGAICALHRTYLTPDGRGKAPVDKAKKVLGDSAGLVIPLWRGESGLPVGEAIAHGLVETLQLSEGCEDGLTEVLAAPQYRTWAVLSLSNLGNVPNLPCFDSAIVHRQNDWQALAAVAQFDAGVARLEGYGWTVAELRAFTGKDVNDTLRGAEH